MQTDIKTLFAAGAHFGFSRTRRHPTATPFLFGAKDRTDVFDLELTGERLAKATAFIASTTSKGSQVLFVGGKHEAVAAIRAAAERAGMPYVAGRWIGGTLTNFKNIRKRIERMERLMGERERGELEKYTKRERLMIDREIEELQHRFGGLAALAELPGALFIVDPRHESVAVKEANQLGIPVVALANSDCDFSVVRYPVPANDTSVRAIRLVTDAVAEACLEGKKNQTAKAKSQSEASAA